MRVRALLLLLFATLIPALVAGLQFLEHRDAEVAAARRDLAAAARAVAQDIEDMARATAQLQYGLSRARDLDTQDRTGCSEFLADGLKQYPQYMNILTFTPAGELFCDSLRRDRTLNVADRRYFQDVRNSGNAVAVEPVYWQRDMGKPYADGRQVATAVKLRELRAALTQLCQGYPEGPAT